MVAIPLLAKEYKPEYEFPKDRMHRRGYVGGLALKG